MSININDLTIGEAKEIVKMFSSISDNNLTVVKHGLQIVVLDKGFVYVGETVTDDKFVRITNAQNIRRWGTSRGLGQLAMFGPQEETQMDPYGSICAPISELKHLIKCEEARW